MTDEEINDFVNSFSEEKKLTKEYVKREPFADTKEKLGKEKFNQYKTELDYIYDLQRQEMINSPYGLPNGRGGIDVFRPLRHKYTAAHCILMGNYNLLTPEQAEGWVKVEMEKYHELTGEYFDLSGIIERKY